MKKRLSNYLLILSVFVGLLVAGVYAYLQHPKFGMLPENGRLEVIKKSPNYADGEFKNFIPTPTLADGNSFLSVVLSNMVTRVERRVPDAPLPSVKTNLKSLDRSRDTVIWLGHSSYFVQLGGKRILIDPVFSTHAAPVPFAANAFEGTSLYEAADMPEIDYLLITHDHWDHLDHPSVTALEPKVRAVVVGLGVGAHFERWGYAQEKIHEADWFDAIRLESGFTVHVLPARHYSGRTLIRNKSLWVGFALETPARRILFSGDTGYGPHFQEIAKRFDGFDLVALDSGQYDPRWPYIHMSPEEASRAAEELNAKALLPAHVGRFALARHAWDDTFRRITVASEDKKFRLLTPLIGEPVRLDEDGQPFSRWWTNVD